MSLLADMLSRLKYQGVKSKRDVPPDLKQVVSDFVGKRAIRKRIVLSSIFVLLAITAGVGAVYYMELYIKPYATKTFRSQSPLSGARPGELAVRPETRDKPLTPFQTEVDKKKQNLKLRSQKSRGESQGLEKKKNMEIKEEIIKGLEKKPEVSAETKDDSLMLKTELQPQTNKPRTPTPELQTQERDVYLYIARTSESRDDYNQAFLNYKKALETDQENYIIMNNISGALIRMGAFEEAIKYLKNALDIRKDYVPSLINLGIAFIRLGGHSEGEAYLSRALSIEPLNRHAILNLGLLYERRRDNDRAFNYFSRLSEMGDIEGYLGTARILENQGRVSDAIRIYREIISMSKIDPKIKKVVSDRLQVLGD